MIILEAILNTLKSGARIVVIVALTSGMILVLHELAPEITQKYNLSEYIEGYKPLLLVAILLGIATVIVNTIFTFKEYIGRKLTVWREDKRRHEILGALSKDEKKFLSRYIENDTSVQRDDYSAGIGNGLQAKGIVFRTSIVAAQGTESFPYTIQPWALKILRKKPKYLEYIEHE